MNLIQLYSSNDKLHFSSLNAEIPGPRSAPEPKFNVVWKSTFVVWNPGFQAEKLNGERVLNCLNRVYSALSVSVKVWTMTDSLRRCVFPEDDRDWLWISDSSSYLVCVEYSLVKSRLLFTFFTFSLWQQKHETKTQVLGLWCTVALETLLSMLISVTVYDAFHEFVRCWWLYFLCGPPP